MGLSVYIDLCSRKIKGYLVSRMSRTDEIISAPDSAVLTEWSVTITGTTFSGQTVNSTLNSTGSEITFKEPNGTYSYVIHLQGGYTAKSSDLKGSLTLTDMTSTISINAQQITYYLLYIAIIIVAIVAVIGVSLVLLRKRK